jgi:hypothetical protein
MAEGVQGAACVICFMTQAFEDSPNCKLELTFAQQSGVPIVPVLMEPNFTAQNWLATLTAGISWIPMHESASVLDGVTKLIAQAQQVIPGMLRDADATSGFASETSEHSSFDVAGWGDEMFSLAEMREELERLRVEIVPVRVRRGSCSSAAGGTDSMLCSLPAMVPPLPRGLFVTDEMQSVLEAVLSDTSAAQIGFCGMGGIGKTTVSSWVAHDDAVRTRFGMIAWISLGQNPTLEACFKLLYLQLKGTELADGLSPDQKHEHLKQAFLHRSVLLVLDDCWDAGIAKHFKWIDQTNTDSKILISSRVRNALEGGEIIDVTMPSTNTAVKMLLSTAGMVVDAFQSREEVAQIAELCNRLPLTIGIAGKLIKEVTHGSSMTDGCDWADVVELLQAELNDPDSDLSVEEHVIRASIKSIPTKIKKHVNRLFVGFALVPEDMNVLTLPVLAMIFDACSSNHSSKQSANQPLSRMHIRNYLKVLIDRSLVLGTVDRPQLHDVMLDYVKKELAGENYKTTQRRLVDAFRIANRSPASATGKYMQLHIKHHITESYDEVWGRSQQAIRWLEDHVNGIQDAIAFSTAAVLPDVHALANEAEDDNLWWSAALRWNAIAYMQMSGAGYDFLKRAVDTAAKITLSSDDAPGDAGNTLKLLLGMTCTQFELDSFSLNAMASLLVSLDSAALKVYGERIGKLALTEAGKSRPVLQIRIVFACEWLPAILSSEPEKSFPICWKLTKMAIDMNDERTEAYACLTADERHLVKPLTLGWAFVGGDAMMRSPEFVLDSYGANGDKLVERSNAYDYYEHHRFLAEVFSGDTWLGVNGCDWLLTLQYGRVADAVAVMEKRLSVMAKVMADNTYSRTRAKDIAMSVSNLLVCFHVHGKQQMARRLIELVGFTFDSVGDFLSDLVRDKTTTYTGMDHTGPGVGGALVSLKRLCWQIKSFLVMHTDVLVGKAIAWLESLPSSDDDFYQVSMTLPSHDPGALFGINHQTCWIALAHEKVGLYEGALRFCRLALEPDMKKAGTPYSKWELTIASACKGRVLMKLSRHIEALAAFQMAIASSKESYPMMEAMAYRELANVHDATLSTTLPAPIATAAAQAGRDLEATLGPFWKGSGCGRLTRAEFDMLTIAPPP